MTAAAAVNRAAALDGPYVGLTPYTQENAALFFGRDAERTALISNLRASRLTLLYAQSGVGKTSVLRAGVAARLGELARRSFEQRGSARYIPVVFSSWRDEPTDELIEEIQRAIVPFLPSASPPGPAPQRLGEMIEAASKATGATLLVMLDQFEEYFLYRSREARDGRFADELAACTNRADLRANFLIAIREDAYSGLGDLFQGRVSNVYANYFHLEHLTKGSARQAIEKPIASYNHLHQSEAPVQIEPGLVDAVLGQVGPDQFAPDQGGAGRLVDGNGAERRDDEVAAPYLQLVMHRLWETELAGGSRTLRLATLDELGGAQEIIQSYVEWALGNLPDDDREAAADILRHLVTPSGTKIALSASDLAYYTKHPVAEVNPLLQRLASVLRTVPPPPGQESGMRFEISHDLLAPAILGWVADRQAARLKREKKIAEQQAQKEKRRARRFGAWAIGTAVLLVGVVILAILAWKSRQQAVSASQQAVLQRDIAVSMQVAGESETLARQEPWIASQLAVAAWRIHPTSKAYASMLNALAQPDRGVLFTSQGRNPYHSVAFSPDGRFLAAAGAGGWVVWDVATHHQIYAFRASRRGAVDSVAFSPDSRFLAAAGADGWALWDVAAHRQIEAFGDSGTGAEDSVAFGRGGRVLATAGADGTARLWNVATHRQTGALRASPAGVVRSVALSPDGTILATAGPGGTARLWNVRTHRQIGAFTTSPSRAVESVAFSPDGTTLATAGADGTVRLWNMATRQQVVGTPLTVIGIPLYSVAFSPDGTTLATAGADGTARLWDRDIYRETGSPLGDRGAVNSVAFGRGGQVLASAGADGWALWNVATHRRIGAFGASGTGALDSVAFSPGGQVLATGGAGGWALWNVATHRPVLVVKDSGAVYSVAFSPGGQVLATGGAGGWALWNVATHRRIGGFGAAVTGPVKAVAFSPDGTILATAGANDSAQLWRVRTLKTVGAPFLSNFSINSVAFSPHGTTMATAGSDGIVRLWNDKILNRYAAGRSIGAPFTFNGPMYSVAFSPDGRILATAGADGKARLWDVATHDQIGAPLTAGSGPVTYVAFSRDGRTLVTADGDGGARLWNVSLPREPVSQVCAISHTSIGLRQWDNYIQGVPFMRICQGNP